ncbi:polymorphic toxin-type HINT domain-containing protein [Fangia hongkongensis]|uniref:polymorphic toxin-type HINT domain-containing protein n=1 Tax=Fangia hongkongensis TaxID=270495 RepID=UPI00039E7276|nr:polymorphic toxin-type HINT domain-containing protein [Fangia hongkongensis]MBK2124371.1 hypothetical protein [Fangia hongkongensis]
MKFVFNRVTETFNFTKPVVELTIHTYLCDEKICCTKEHSVYLQGKGFTAVSKLKELTKAKKLIGVSVYGNNPQITCIESNNLEKVYNITVNKSHTYFVGNSGLWVHNTCGGVEMGLLDRRDPAQIPLPKQLYEAQLMEPIALPSVDSMEVIGQGSYGRAYKWGDKAVKRMHRESNDSLLLYRNVDAANKSYGAGYSQVGRFADGRLAQITPFTDAPQDSPVEALRAAYKKGRFLIDCNVQGNSKGGVIIDWDQAVAPGSPYSRVILASPNGIGVIAVQMYWQYGRDTGAQIPYEWFKSLSRE